jgi:hypothetical protein
MSPAEGDSLLQSDSFQSGDDSVGLLAQLHVLRFSLYQDRNVKVCVFP